MSAPPFVTRPAWADRLQAGVDAAFAVTGADTPGWPDPNPDRNPPEEAYSRVLDPGKYRILGARVRAWVTVLSDRGIATAREVAAPEPWVGAVRPPDAWALVRRIDPSRPGALSLLLATTLVDAEPFGLDIGIADAAGPPVLLETLPDCGCDACDSGSADLLRCLDERVLSVARGGVLHARGRDRTATLQLDGWSSSGTPRLEGDEREWLDPSAAAPDDVRRWAGTAWL